MNQYRSIEDEIANLKKPLKLGNWIGIILNLVILGIFIFVHMSEKEKVHYSSMEACFYGMDAIFSNGDKPDLVDQKVTDDIRDNKINFKVDRIHLVKYIDGFSCDVVSFDPKGYRSFRVLLEKNQKYDHLYKISNVAERKIKSSYQR